MQILKVVLCLALSGCIQVFPDPGLSPQLVQVRLRLDKDKDLSPVNWQLGIEEPFTAPALDSARIAVRVNSSDKASYLSFIKGKEWQARLPLLVQTLMVEAFESTKKMNGVARVSQGLNFDHILMTEINNYGFNILENQQSVEAEVQITAKLLRIPERKVIATETFHEKISSPTQEFLPMLMALENATGKLFSSLTRWVVKHKG